MSYSIVYCRLAGWRGHGVASSFCIRVHRSSVVHMVTHLVHSSVCLQMTRRFLQGSAPAPLILPYSLLCRSISRSSLSFHVLYFALFLCSTPSLLLCSLILFSPLLRFLYPILYLYWMPFAMLIESISLANYNHNMQIVPMCSDRVLGEWDKSDWRENPLNLLIPPSLSKCVHPISSRCKLCLISFFNPFRGSGHTPPVLK